MDLHSEAGFIEYSSSRLSTPYENDDYETAQRTNLHSEAGFIENSSSRLSVPYENDDDETAQRTNLRGEAAEPYANEDETAQGMQMNFHREAGFQHSKSIKNRSDANKRQGLQHSNESSVRLGM